ncbi:unnamed protein product, partial [Ectocarpus sp. 12 AP-2014]
MLCALLSFVYVKNLGGVTWPVDLECLKFGCRFNETLERTRLPRRLAALKTCFHWDHPLALVLDLPESLKFLQLSDAFDQPLDEVRFPPGLAYLYLGDNFDQPLHDAQWPTNLKVLYLDDSFDHSIGIQEWPEGLESLFLGGNFSGDIDTIVWPDSLTTINVGCIPCDFDDITWPSPSLGDCSGTHSSLE